MAFLAVLLGKLCVLLPAGQRDLQRAPTHVTAVQLAFKTHTGNYTGTPGCLKPSQEA